MSNFENLLLWKQV